jgi:protein gp37
MKMAHRSSGAGGAYEGLTKLSKGGPVWTGEIRLVEDLLYQPLHWKRPRRIFVNSMSDLFHEDVPNAFLQKVWLVMGQARQHVFQILTKRPQRMLSWLTSFNGDGGLDSVRWGEDVELAQLEKEFPWPLPNVWLGVSVEDQAAADERIPLLLQTPAAVRWISAEPLLGPVDLHHPVYKIIKDQPDYSTALRAAMPYAGVEINWVVAGGESGPGARPMHPDWARSLRDQCAAAKVPFFFKQWGNWLPAMQDGNPDHRPLIINASDHALLTTKKAAGRQLDGRTHDEYPA